MKSGRVPRKLRQWGNFIFLLGLLSVAGWYSYHAALQQTAEVPTGYAIVEVKRSLLFWREPEVSLKGAGRHGISKRDVEKVARGELLCYPVKDLGVEIEGILDASSMYEGLKARVGLGQKTFISFSGHATIHLDEDTLRRLGKDDLLASLKTSLEKALVDAQTEVKGGTEEKFGPHLEESWKAALGVGSIDIELSKREKTATGVPMLSVRFADGALVAPKLVEEIPLSGYLGVAVALFGTVVAYGFVRIVFGEIFGILIAVAIGLPLAALGYDMFRVQEAGHYSARRRNRSSHGGPGIDLTPGVEVLGDLVNVAGDAVHSADGIGGATEGLSEAAGSIFDALGGIGDIF